MKKIKVAQTNIYRYNLYDEIELFSDYEELIEDSVSLNSNDNVVLYINSPGGRVDVGVSIINSIQSSKAKFTAIVEGPSYSMASIIALACDDMLMCKNTFLMFHNYSSMSYGKGGELMESLKHGDKHFTQLMKDVCSPFLTKPELNKISKDMDVYVYDSDENLEKRVARHFK